MNHTTSQRGYTLLFAVLLTSMVLAISVSILTISQKELILSSSSRESQASLYAADSALECAQYYDEKGLLATSSNTLLVCNGQDADALPITYPTSANPAVRVSDVIGPFYIDPNPATRRACATITVTKQYGQSSGLTTIIEARGYNTCTAGDPRRTERGMSITY